jgi:hypothetical protein
MMYFFLKYPFCTCISFEGLSHLYLKDMGLCVTRPSVTRWGTYPEEHWAKGSEDRSYHPRHHLQESRVVDGIGVIAITRNSTRTQLKCRYVSPTYTLVSQKSHGGGNVDWTYPKLDKPIPRCSNNF